MANKFRNRLCASRLACLCILSCCIAACSPTHIAHEVYTEGYNWDTQARPIDCGSYRVDIKDTLIEMHSEILGFLEEQGILDGYEGVLDFDIPTSIGHKTYGRHEFVQVLYADFLEDAPTVIIEGGVAVTIDLCKKQPIYAGLFRW